MKRRFGAWVGQYFLVSVVVTRPPNDGIPRAHHESRWKGDSKRCPGSCRFPTNYSIVKTASAINSFFLAATLHPKFVCLAQSELDEVLDGEHLPNFSDKPRLPYISAIVKEVLRWRPPILLRVVLVHHLVHESVLTGFRNPASIDGGRRLQRNVHPRRCHGRGQHMVCNPVLLVRSRS